MILAYGRYEYPNNKYSTRDILLEYTILSDSEIENYVLQLLESLSLVDLINLYQYIWCKNISINDKNKSIDICNGRFKLTNEQYKYINKTIIDYLECYFKVIKNYPKCVIENVKIKESRIFGREKV